jgi:SulP family sulfate permease
VSLAIAVIAIFETLLVYRAAQTMADRPIGSVRDAVALGIGNCASAGVGGIAFSAALGQTQSVYREGGRTRLVPVTIGLVILGLTTGAGGLLGAIPVAAISALLLQNTLRRIDMWSVRLFAETLRSPPSPQRRRAWFDLAVVAVVMGVTVTVSVVPGVLAGVVVAGVIFIANMSRPVVRRRHSGRSIMSKRMRSAYDFELLRGTGDRRVVLELGGVLFFGNADDLSATVSELFDEADTIILNLHGVADIDVSGATILHNLVERSRKRRKDLLFCNIPPVFAKRLDKIAGTNPSSVFPDRDAALEWAEEKVLRAHAEDRAMPSVLSPEQHDFLRGLDCSELAVLAPYLKRREFRIGDVLCQEGDPADRMWLLMKGNVSIRLRSPDKRSGRRIAGCAPGTTVGEMAVVDGGFRSASVVADDDLVCYELESSTFEWVLRDYPALASKLLTNMARALAQRVRGASEELREVAN